jgi:hypothetical protein
LYQMQDDWADYNNEGNYEDLWCKHRYIENK